VDEIIFTSGGSESNNYAIMGGARRMKRLHGLDHIVTSCIEHPAVLEVCKALEVFEGFRVTFLPVDKYGMVSCEDVEKAVTEKTALVTIMHTNNEVGTFQPIADIVKIVRKINGKTLVHCDGAQSVGKAEFAVSDMGVDLFSVAAHKFYGPKGVGALFIRRSVELDKILHGADHERNHRPGTENVLNLVGLGMAAHIADRDSKKNIEHMRECRDLLFDLLKEGLGEENIRVNGHPEKRLCNTLNVVLRGIDATTLLADISDRVAAR
jgi:cysteine desulfurase